MPPYQPNPQTPQQPQSVPPSQPVTPLPTPSAPPAPTPVFGQSPMFDAATVEHKFPFWIIPLIAVGVLGSAALLICVIVFMR